MTEQLALMDFPSGPPTDRLFLGIFPDRAAAEQIARTAQALRTRHGLSGRSLAPERFHVTLVHLGDYHGLPASLAKTAREAAATVTRPPFDVVFDRVASFAGKAGKLPFVLRGDQGLAPLMTFQQMLGEALKKAGLGRHVAPQFTPHVTLLYDAQSVPAQPVEPVGWTAKEFVLVHSLLGKTQHLPLGHWPLR